MGARKIKGSKRAFETTEEILTFSQRTADFVREKPYWIMGAVGAIVLLLGVIWGGSLYFDAQERNARTDYAQVIAKWPVGELANFQEWDQLAAQLQDCITRHRGTQTARNAQLDLARAYFWTKKYEESLQAADQLLQQLPADSSLQPLVRYHLALTYEQTGKIDASIAQLEALSKIGNEGLQREIDWRLARLYLSKKEYPRAVEQYEKALKTTIGYPDTPLIQEELTVARLKLGPAAKQAQPGPAKQDQPG